MKPTLTVLAALIAAVSATAVWTHADTVVTERKTEVRDVDRTTTIDKQPLNAVTADNDVHKDIRNMLAKLVDHAYDPGNFNNVVGYLTKADKERIGELKKDDLKDVDAKLDALRKDFKDKYGENFDITADHFKDITVMASGDKKTATVTFKNFDIGPAKAEMKAVGDNLAAGDLAKAGQNANAAINKLDSKSGNLSLTLFNEGAVLNDWRIDANDTLTAQQLKASLLKHLSMFHDNKANWPSDKHLAYRQAAFHIIEALNDTNMATDK